MATHLDLTISGDECGCCEEVFETCTDAKNAWPPTGGGLDFEVSGFQDLSFTTYSVPGCTVANTDAYTYSNLNGSYNDPVIVGGNGEIVWGTQGNIADPGRLLRSLTRTGFTFLEYAWKMEVGTVVCATTGYSCPDGKWQTRLASNFTSGGTAYCIRLGVSTYTNGTNSSNVNYFLFPFGSATLTNSPCIYGFTGYEVSGVISGNSLETFSNAQTTCASTSQGYRANNLTVALTPIAA